MEISVRLRIILKDAIPGVLFALQSGSGSVYETIQKQYSGEKDLVFEEPVIVKQAGGEEPDFKGKIVQGPKGGRFIYIDIGTYAGDKKSVWARRLKIPLTGISIDPTKNKPGVFETHIPGKGRDAGPNCGTVKPFPGWKFVQN